MCFVIGKGRLTTRRVYKVFYQEPNGDLIGIYYNMRFQLGKIKRIAALSRSIDSEDERGCSKHGLYVFTNKARALQVLAIQRSFDNNVRVVLVRCEVDPADFLYRSKRYKKHINKCEATYRAIKPLKVIS